MEPRIRVPIDALVTFSGSNPFVPETLGCKGWSPASVNAFKADTPNKCAKPSDDLFLCEFTVSTKNGTVSSQSRQAPRHFFPACRSQSGSAIWCSASGSSSSHGSKVTPLHSSEGPLGTSPSRVRVRFPGAGCFSGPGHPHSYRGDAVYEGSSSGLNGCRSSSSTELFYNCPPSSSVPALRLNTGSKSGSKPEQLASKEESASVQRGSRIHATGESTFVSRAAGGVVPHRPVQSSSLRLPGVAQTPSFPSTTPLVMNPASSPSYPGAIPPSAWPSSTSNAAPKWHATGGFSPTSQTTVLGLHRPFGIESSMDAPTNRERGAASHQTIPAKLPSQMHALERPVLPHTIPRQFTSPQPSCAKHDAVEHQSISRHPQCVSTITGDRVNKEATTADISRSDCASIGVARTLPADSPLGGASPPYLPSSPQIVVTPSSYRQSVGWNVKKRNEADASLLLAQSTPTSSHRSDEIKKILNECGIGSEDKWILSALGGDSDARSSDWRPGLMSSLASRVPPIELHGIRDLALHRNDNYLRSCLPDELAGGGGIQFPESLLTSPSLMVVSSGPPTNEDGSPFLIYGVDSPLCESSQHCGALEKDKLVNVNQRNDVKGDVFDDSQEKEVDKKRCADAFAASETTKENQRAVDSQPAEEHLAVSLASYSGELSALIIPERLKQLEEEQDASHDNKKQQTGQSEETPRCSMCGQLLPRIKQNEITEGWMRCPILEDSYPVDAAIPFPLNAVEFLEPHEDLDNGSRKSLIAGECIANQETQEPPTTESEAPSTRAAESLTNARPSQQYPAPADEEIFAGGRFSETTTATSETTPSDGHGGFLDDNTGGSLPTSVFSESPALDTADMSENSPRVEDEERATTLKTSGKHDETSRREKKIPTFFPEETDADKKASIAPMVMDAATVPASFGRLIDLPRPPHLNSRTPFADLDEDEEEEEEEVFLTVATSVDKDNEDEIGDSGASVNPTTLLLSCLPMTSENPSAAIEPMKCVGSLYETNQTGDSMALGLVESLGTSRCQRYQTHASTTMRSMDFTRIEQSLGAEETASDTPTTEAATPNNTNNVERKTFGVGDVDFAKNPCERPMTLQEVSLAQSGVPLPSGASTMDSQLTGLATDLISSVLASLAATDDLSSDGPLLRPVDTKDKQSTTEKKVIPEQSPDPVFTETAVGAPVSSNALPKNVRDITIPAKQPQRLITEDSRTLLHTHRQKEVTKCPQAHVILLDVDDTLFPTTLFSENEWLDKTLDSIPSNVRSTLARLDETLCELFKLLHMMVILEEVHPGSAPVAASTTPDKLPTSPSKGSFLQFCETINADEGSKTHEHEFQQNERNPGRLQLPLAAHHRSMPNSIAEASQIPETTTEQPESDTQQNPVATARSLTSSDGSCNTQGEKYPEDTTGQAVPAKATTSNPSSCPSSPRSKTGWNYLLSVVIVTNAAMGHIQALFPRFLPRLYAYLEEKEIKLDDLVCSARDLWADDFPFETFYTFWKAWTLEDILSRLASDGVPQVTVVSFGDDEPERRAAAFVSAEMSSLVKSTKIIKMLSQPGVETLIAQVQYVHLFFRAMISRVASFDTYLQVNFAHPVVMLVLKAAWLNHFDVVSDDFPANEEASSSYIERRRDNKRVQAIPLLPLKCPLGTEDQKWRHQIQEKCTIPPVVMDGLLHKEQFDGNNTKQESKSAVVAGAIITIASVDSPRECTAFIVRELVQQTPPETPSSLEAALLQFEMKFEGFYDLFGDATPQRMGALAAYCRKLARKEPESMKTFREDICSFLKQAKSSSILPTWKQEEIEECFANEVSRAPTFGGLGSGVQELAVTPRESTSTMDVDSFTSFCSESPRALLSVVDGVLKFFVQIKGLVDTFQGLEQKFLLVNVATVLKQALDLTEGRADTPADVEAKQS